MKKNQGFTLIEVLLVIVIIGILAAITFAMIGNSDNAKVKSLLSTAKTVMPYGQECVFKGWTFQDPTDADSNGADLGDTICSSGAEDSDTEWPELSVEGCAYTITNDADGVFRIDCTDITDKYIECDCKNGYCKELDK